MKTILKTNKLCKSFSTGGMQQHILKNLDLEIYESDFTVIMGSSGAGKSTLLYALSGMDKPTLGEIFYEDEEISKYTDDKLAIFRRKNCGFVFQQIFLLDNMSVMDNILSCGLLVNKNKKQLIDYAEELLKKVELNPIDWDKFPSQLSGGEAQRAAIVRAMINRPKIVFADEPTGALNSAYGKAVLDVITDVNETGQSIIMVTHDIKSAMRGNRIIYLKDGTVCGECKLNKYKKDETERLHVVNAFLNEMGW